MPSEQQLQARLITNVGLNESIKDSLQDAGQTDWAQRCSVLLRTAHTIWEMLSKNTKCEKGTVFPATSIRPGDACVQMTSENTVSQT